MLPDRHLPSALITRLSAAAIATPGVACSESAVDYFHVVAAALPRAGRAFLRRLFSLVVASLESSVSSIGAGGKMWI